LSNYLQHDVFPWYNYELFPHLEELRNIWKKKFSSLVFSFQIEVFVEKVYIFLFKLFSLIIIVFWNLHVMMMTSATLLSSITRSNSPKQAMGSLCGSGRVWWKMKNCILSLALSGQIFWLPQFLIFWLWGAP
jgi:hypothetical protein